MTLTKKKNLIFLISLLLFISSCETLNEIAGIEKTVIEDSGKRIVKAVMQPINSIPRNTHIKETSFSSKMESWLQPYRSYFGYMAPTFAPAHITSFLVTQWVSTIAITIAWITVGYMWQSMTGRSSEGRSIEPWESLVPDSGTMAVVLQDLSDAAQRWHDELWVPAASRGVLEGEYVFTCMHSAPKYTYDT